VNFHNVITLLLQFILRKPMNVAGTSSGYFNVMFQEYSFIFKDLFALKCVCLSDHFFSQNLVTSHMFLSVHYWISRR
jgi:hypothetical protein